jgi:hypothetical protein
MSFLTFATLNQTTYLVSGMVWKKKEDIYWKRPVGVRQSPPESANQILNSDYTESFATKAFGFSTMSTEYPFTVSYKFFSTTVRLKDDILLAQPADHRPINPPDILPRAVVILLSRICDISESAVGDYWDRFKEDVWHSSDLQLWDSAVEALFSTYGQDLGFRAYSTPTDKVVIMCKTASSRTLYPPQHICINEACSRSARGLRLQKAESRQAVLYTLSEGALPVWVVHLYCEGL